MKQLGDSMVGRQEGTWVVLSGDEGYVPNKNLRREPGRVGIGVGIGVGLRQAFFQWRGREPTHCAPTENKSSIWDILSGRSFQGGIYLRLFPFPWWNP